VTFFTPENATSTRIDAAAAAPAAVAPAGPVIPTPCIFPPSACVVKVNNCVEEPLECGQATRSTERAKSLTN
jgi:hypothetical protein